MKNIGVFNNDFMIFGLKQLK